jgi:poly(hydroxyalkanoate) depolymerase family esterase
VLNLHKTIAKLNENRARWSKLMRGAGDIRAPEVGTMTTRLRQVHDFGSDPGNLRMFSYVPPRPAANPALVVVLHGCTQTAAGYDHGAGWSTLADRYGFVLLLPEQQRSNNPNGCFNWFQPGDIERGRGEALSIRQMVEKIAIDQNIDRHRVFITGLSAGGAMTSVMLACYPEVFAGGAIIAGLPFGAATNVQQAFESMFQSPTRSAREWGDIVRKATSHTGPWPRISVWHGSADKTVIPANAHEIIKQWTDVHDLPTRPSMQAVVNGYCRHVWSNETNDQVIESYTIANMAHGAPLATGAADDQCGAAGPFLLEVGISSSYHIARFFGLTDTLTTGDTATIVPDLEHVGRPAPAFTQPHVLEGEVLDKEFDDAPRRKQGSPPLPIDIGGVINQALEAAGLIRRR